MQEFNIKHSLKYIPIASKFVLLNKIESFLRRMSWKALFVLNKYISVPDDVDIYHLGTRWYPPTVEEESSFKKNLLGFQKEMSANVVEEIKKTMKILVMVDKIKKYIFK